MSYQTLVNQAENLAGDCAAWLFSDVTNVLYVVAGIAVLGVINGIRRSLQYDKFIGHCGRRVL